MEGYGTHGDGIGVHTGGVGDGRIVRDRLPIRAEGTTWPTTDTDGDALALEAHHLDAFATDAIAFVLACLGLHGGIEHLLLLLGPLRLGLSENLLELLLLLDGTIARAFVLATTTLFKDLNDLEIVLRAGVLGLLLDFRYAFAKTGRAGTRLVVLAVLALRHFGHGLVLALGRTASGGLLVGIVISVGWRVRVGTGLAITRRGGG